MQPTPAVSAEEIAKKRTEISIQIVAMRKTIQNLEKEEQTTENEANLNDFRAGLADLESKHADLIQQANLSITGTRAGQSSSSK